jgi:hypothetical protein
VSHHFEFIVAADVDRIAGKFATREEMEQIISEALDSANPGDLECDEGGEYEITDWVVEVHEGWRK